MHEEEEITEKLKDNFELFNHNVVEYYLFKIFLNCHKVLVKISKKTTSICPIFPQKIHARKLRRKIFNKSIRSDFPYKFYEYVSV